MGCPVRAHATKGDAQSHCDFPFLITDILECIWLVLQSSTARLNKQESKKKISQLRILDISKEDEFKMGTIHALLFLPFCECVCLRTRERG